MTEHGLLHYFWTLLACALLAFAGPASADERKPEEMLKNLAQQARSIKSVKSRFTQTRHVSFMDEAVVSEGNFIFTAPDKLLWQYTSPMQSALVYGNGKARFLTDAQAGGGADSASPPSQAEQKLARMIAGHILMWVAMDVDAIEKAYAIELISDAPLTLKLSPKEQAKGGPIRDIVIEFLDQSAQVAFVTLYDLDGDSTRLAFFDTEQK